MGPTTARAGVIFGCMGSPSNFGVEMSLTSSEPFAIGLAVMSAMELDAAALVAFAEVPEELLIPFDETLGVVSLGEGILW